MTTKKKSKKVKKSKRGPRVLDKGQIKPGGDPAAFAQRKMITHPGLGQTVEQDHSPRNHHDPAEADGIQFFT